MGILYGYHKDDIDFFVSSTWKGFKYAYKVIGKLDELSYFLRESGLEGEGFIPSPKTLDGVISGKTTYNNVIEGINSRRVIKSSFPVSEPKPSTKDPITGNKVPQFISRLGSSGELERAKKMKKLAMTKRDLLKAFYIYKAYYGVDDFYEARNEVVERLFKK